MSTPIPKFSSRPSYDHCYFETLHRAHADPWDVLGSPYEHAKFAATLRALRRQRYRNALELGCSVGGLTRWLAPRCDALTAVDTSPAALLRARENCREPQVRFLQAHLPEGDWQGAYDLVVLSELLYYFTPHEQQQLAERLHACVAPHHTDVIVVHWTGETDYPLSGDGATELFRQLMHASCRSQVREPMYRLERWTVADRP